MFEHNKNKNPESKNQTESKADRNNAVVFHTMKDDLKAMDGKITLTNEKESDADTGKVGLKKENERVSPFSGNAFKKPDAPAAASNPLYGKLVIKPEVSNAKNLKSSVLSNAHGIPIPKDKKKNKISNFLISIIIILITFSIALGSYLLWKTGNSVEVAIEPPTETPTEEPESTETLVEKYSSENPNYLPIDTESDSAEDIAQLLIQTASEIKESKSDGSFEFVVTDANNNPLSFSIFTYLSKINLSKSVLNSFDESFSLYFYRDGGNVRTGLAIDIKNKETAISEITKEESVLPEELQPIFLNNSFSETGKSFSASQYKDFQIRYINLNEDNTLSVDYSIIENQLVMGTSKNTTREIIDRIEAEQLENLTEDNEEDVDIEL